MKKTLFIALLLLPISIFAQGGIADIVIPYISKFFVDNVAMIGAVMGLTLAASKLLDHFMELNKWIKIGLAFVIWLALAYIGTVWDIGFMADITYVDALKLTFNDWLAASGLYTILSSIPFVKDLLKTKNQEVKEEPVA